MIDPASMPEGQRGRPPKETHKKGRSMFRFEVPDDIAVRIRKKAGDREMMRFLAETVCEGLGIKLPPPKKRGPKPKV